MNNDPAWLPPMMLFGLLALPFLWLALVVGASILYRRRAGKPIFPHLPANARFAERGGSGRSHRNVLTRLGGASRCLLVAVTDERLIVSPFFPFTLMFLPEIYDLEHSSPARAIREVEDRQGMVRRTIFVSFDNPDPRQIALRVRDPDALLAALRALAREARAVRRTR